MLYPDARKRAGAARKPGLLTKRLVHTAFDDVVRLGLRYAKPWRLWLDQWVLAQTSRPMPAGERAY